MYIHRDLEKPLKEALSQFPVVLVTGCRQSGKSTLSQGREKTCPFTGRLNRAVDAILNHSVIYCHDF